MDLTQMISLNDTLENLNLRERNILTGYYLYGYNQRELANHYNISDRRVAQIRRKALEKCKKRLCVMIAGV